MTLSENRSPTADLDENEFIDVVRIPLSKLSDALFGTTSGLYDYLVPAARLTQRIEFDAKGFVIDSRLMSFALAVSMYPEFIAGRDSTAHV